MEGEVVWKERRWCRAKKGLGFGPLEVRYITNLSQFYANFGAFCEFALFTLLLPLLVRAIVLEK